MQGFLIYVLLRELVLRTLTTDSKDKYEGTADLCAWRLKENHCPYTLLFISAAPVSSRRYNIIVHVFFVQEQIALPLTHSLSYSLTLSHSQVMQSRQEQRQEEAAERRLRKASKEVLQMRGQSHKEPLPVHTFRYVSSSTVHFSQCKYPSVQA